MRRALPAWRNLSLRGKGLVVVVVPMVVISAMVAWSYRAERAEGAAESGVRSALQTLTATQDVLGLTVDMESGLRGYLLTGRREFLDPYFAAKPDLDPAMARLESLVRNQRLQLQSLRVVQALTGQKDQLANTIIANRIALAPSPERQTALLVQSKAIQDGIRQALSTIRSDARLQIDTELARARRARNRRIVTVVGGAAAGLAAGILALALFSNGVVRRVRLLQENARLLASGASLLALPPGEDEIGRLGREFRKTATLLGEKDEQLGMSIEATGIVLWEYDPASGMILWPEHHLGSIRSEHLPERFTNLMERLDPADRPAVEEAFRTVTRDGELDVEFCVPMNGEIRWFEAWGRLVDDHQGNLRLLGLVIDATTRKQAEQTLRESEARKTAILASIGEAVMITDPAGNIVSVNPAMERLAGWSSDEVRGKGYDFYTILDAAGRPVEREDRLLGRALEAGMPLATRGCEKTLLCRDGSRVPVTATAAPIVDDTGTLLGGVEILGDVSFEREVDQLKSSLVSTVSHELRTPLTMIQGFSELILTRKPAPEKTEEALRHINTSAQRLARVIDDLLTVSRIESGRNEVRAFPLDLRGPLEEVVANYRDRRQVKIDLDANLPLILADPDMLIQILTNLVSNAVKYSPPDAPIGLVARRQGDCAEISVVDRGVGMDEAEQARLFERFFRAERAEVQAVGGTGLGLYITKNLVELQGGRIWAEAALGRGSTFTFSLPLATARQGAAL